MTPEPLDLSSAPADHPMMPPDNSLAPPPRTCAACGVPLSGYPGLCPACDPDAKAVVMARVPRKTPALCPACLRSHVDSHVGGSGGDAS